MKRIHLYAPAVVIVVVLGALLWRARAERIERERIEGEREDMRRFYLEGDWASEIVR